MAEEVGFEPTVPFGTTVFKTAAFNHSAIPPLDNQNRIIKNRRFCKSESSRIAALFLPIVLWICLICYHSCMRETDEYYMRMAIEQAKLAEEIGEIPIGAVVVYEPIDKATRKPVANAEVISQAHNLRETEKDPSAHAEFIAMLAASKALDAWRLTDCTVYVTLEPCIMCAGLMHQSRIARCVFGASDQKAGALGTLYSINADERLNHRFDVIGGVCEEECAALLTNFFKKKRNK